MRKPSHRLPFEVLYEDRDVLVVDKPAGLLTTHTPLETRAARLAQPTVENIINDFIRKGQAKSSKRVYLVHRLDRDTSGVLMFAKAEHVANAFRANWNEITEKIYLARVQGLLEADHGTFESYLRDNPKTMCVSSVQDERYGKLAHTDWRAISIRNNTTLVEVSIKSGRKNQIRVHFSEDGHPIIGDVKYGGPPASRLYLHALSLGFHHPFLGEWITVVSRQIIPGLTTDINE